MSKPKEYILGQVVSVYTSEPFTDANGVVGDPTALTVVATRHGRNPTTYTYGVDPQIVRESVGNYRFDFIPGETGLWKVRWASTGAYQTATETTLLLGSRHLTTI